MSLTRDEGAPISVSKEQIAKFQKRNDIAKFRAMIQASTNKSEKTRLYNQIKNTVNTCIKLQLDEDRRAYFKEADRLRLQGLEPEPTPGARGAGIAAPVAALLSCPRPQNDGESLAVGASVSERYIDAQLLHLRSIALSSPRGVPKTAAASKSQQNSCCFICSRGFANRSCLTRHFRDAHLVDGTFDNPLTCRECDRVGGAEVVVHDPAQWCNHLEHTHGLIHTPSANPGVNPRDCMSNSLSICLLCEVPMASTSALLADMNRTEIPRFCKDARVDCRPCIREGRVDGEPMSIWEWLTHARAVHKWSLPHEPCPLCGHLCAPGRGFQKHLTTQHSQRLGEALESAACVASTTPVGEMQGIGGLLQHTIEKHPSGQAATNVARGKRKRHSDSEYTAPTGESKEGKEDGDDGEYTAPAAEGKEGCADRGDTPPAAKRKRAATYDVADKEGPSPVVIFGADSDPCEDVIICAPTIDEQQRRYLAENHMGPSAVLDSDF